MTHLTKEQLEAALAWLNNYPFMDKGLMKLHDDLPHIQTIRQTLIDAKTAPIGWNFNMDEAPRGDDSPYSKVSDNHSEYVLVWNGYHRGIGYLCLDYEGKDYDWIDESGEFIDPKPIAWQHLPTPPEKSE